MLFLYSEYNLSFVTLTLFIHGVKWRKLLLCHLVPPLPFVMFCFGKYLVRSIVHF
jgi:hypothetical protein